LPNNKLSIVEIEILKKHRSEYIYCEPNIIQSSITIHHSHQ